ncbi:MAG TPA: hypothetical protein VHA33_22190 [Candidatus Angelobacter sp.]|jgi:hypothetical protein|nr:hypothetical protein [Candidatus Angelobacter sp.]
MKTHSSHRSRVRRCSVRNGVQSTILDPDVLAPEPAVQEESDIDWEWEGIARRGNRKPNLDDYDRWPMIVGSLAGDKTGRNHF